VPDVLNEWRIWIEPSSGTMFEIVSTSLCDAVAAKAPVGAASFSQWRKPLVKF